MLSVAIKVQPNDRANLPKYAVHGRGTFKPPAPVPPWLLA